eukprot:4656345-Lingulodinium_polyedra.AAC.1
MCIRDSPWDVLGWSLGGPWGARGMSSDNTTSPRNPHGTGMSSGCRWDVLGTSLARPWDVLGAPSGRRWD